MQSDSKQIGYQFTRQELAVIRETLERVQGSKGVRLAATTGEAQGFAAARIGLDDAALRAHGDLVHVQSFRDEDGEVFFVVRSIPDSEQVGPSAGYRTFQTAMAHTQVFLVTVIDALVARKAQSKRPSFLQRLFG